MEDSEIIGLFFERSEQAIVELSKKYGTVCTRLANNIVNNPQDAEECVNDAYLGVWNSVPPENPKSLFGYLCRIVRNRAANRYHSNTALKRNGSYDVALDELENCFPAATSVEEEFDAKETAGQIEAFLDTLDAKDRILFVRRYWYADSIAELAVRFHTSRHNISVRLSRIREKLRKYLVKKGIFV